MNTDLHFSFRWYLARITLLEKKLETIPAYRTGMHSGKEVVRYWDGKRFKEVYRNSKHYSELLSTAQQRTSIESELKRLRKEWKEYFDFGIDYVKKQYAVVPNSISPMNYASWERLIDCECPVEKNADLALGHRIYRSRVELRVAEAATDLGLNFKYDCGIRLSEDYTDFLDLAFGFEEFNRWVAMEVFGMLDRQDYVSKQGSKITRYMNHGIYINRDLFIESSDSRYMDNIEVFKKDLIHMVNKLSDRYVVKLDSRESH